jgi:hypothetical protein
MGGHLIPGGNRQAVDRLNRLETATIRNPNATASENKGFGNTVKAQKKKEVSKWTKKEPPYARRLGDRLE